ncbi:TauD/TfdA family dioxygenase [Pseudomonadales bacterium]|nr:TauD/TfdA family dioxygenase [Pseudomonadales bacterium]
MSLAQQASAAFTVERLSPTIGAELCGIDLGQALPDSTIAEIYQALLDYKVIFFRDQNITSQQHLAFGRRFGNLEVHPFAAQDPEFPELLRITHNQENKGQENLWHSDVTWRAEPSLGSILHAHEIPEVGGDTLFADMGQAYDDLSDSLKEQLDGLTAIHDAVGFHRRMREKGASEEQVNAMREQYPAQEHPVIRTHPDTGRKTLYVNRAFTQSIVGMSAEDSQTLLEQLYRTAAVPEYQCRFKWRPNSIAFWDNRSCQHYAVSDYWPQIRSVERVTIIGDKPR